MTIKDKDTVRFVLKNKFKLNTKSMKKKYLFMLPAISLVATTSSWAQAVADVPAAAKINQKADFVEAKSTDKLLKEFAELISDKAKAVGQDVDGKKLIATLGLDQITSYAMSSEKVGSEWKNLMFLHNGGSEKGIFPLLGKTNAEFSAPSMCPGTSDLVIQLDLDLRTAEDLIRKVMKAGKATQGDLEGFEQSVKEKLPIIDMTSSALMSKLNLRINLAIDLDDKEKIPLPMVGAIEKPRVVIRLDHIAWIWDKVGSTLIENTGLPFQKKEVDGIITYSLPEEMAAALMGYTPIIKIDKKSNHIWIASSPAFLKRSTLPNESLANSLAFKGTIKGLPSKGNSMTYMSKNLADIIIRLGEKAKADGMLDMLGEQKDEITTMLDNLKKIDQGAISILTKTKDGILLSHRNYEDFKTAIDKFKEQIKNL